MDHYSTLGVARSATPEEIKRAYRKLASQHHPDKGGDKNKFQEIEQAYRILSDPQQRQQYDNPNPFNRSGTYSDAGFQEFNFNDIFNMFGVHARNQRGPGNARLSLWISLEDVARGGPQVIAVQMGNSVSNIEIDLPVGLNDGDAIRYPGLAPNNQDLVITYRIKPHPNWHRDKRNITTEKDVSIWDLIIGGDVEVTDLTGSTLSLTIPPRTQPGSLLRARGRGLPNTNLPGVPTSPPGDLFVKVRAVIPPTISSDLISAITNERNQ